MNFDALTAFGAFTEHMNFTRAAASLGISQPALHTKIRKLGEELEIVLYERIGRALQLTADGERLASFAREIASRTSDFEEQVFGQRGEPITFAAGRGAHLYILGDSIRRFLRKFGKLDLRTMNSEEAMADVCSGRVHLGVVTSEVRAPLASRIVRRVRQVVVVPNEHPLSSRSLLRPKDLHGSRLVVPPTGRPQREQIERVLGEAGGSWRLGVEADGWDLILHFVAERIGIAIVNDCVPIPRGLRAVPIQDFPELAYRLIWRRKMANDQVEYLVEQIIGAQD